MHKVLIPTKLDKFAAELLVKNGFEVVQDPATPLAEQAKTHPDAVAMIVRSEAVTPEIIDLLPALKLVVRAGAGYNTIDIKYARKKNIDVMNTPGANSNAVAEEVVALILAAYRFVVPADISTRRGDWEKSKFLGRELTGKTVGILGLGHIGQLLVKRLAGFEVKVLGFDPMMSPEFAAELGVQLCTVEEIFSQADIVSLHIPENNETRGMINASLLGLMKNGAMLVNCARWGIINEADLRAAKAEKGIIYCNDVYAKDAAGEKSVADIADVMLPHLGANTREANFVAARRAAEQTIDYYTKGITKCVVNKALPDGLDAIYQELAYALTSVGMLYLGSNPTLIETSFYGKLAEFAKWMTAPIAAGIAAEFAPDNASKDAENFLNERGVALTNREADQDKKYGESMTIDLVSGGSRVSVRGTIVENRLMISRLNDYDNLYLNPVGTHIFVEYKDEPGVIGKIASLIGGCNINIIDLRAPQDLKNGKSLAVVQVDGKADAELLKKIGEAVSACRVFQMTFTGK